MTAKVAWKHRADLVARCLIWDGIDFTVITDGKENFTFRVTMNSAEHLSKAVAEAMERYPDAKVA